MQGSGGEEEEEELNKCELASKKSSIKKQHKEVREFVNDEPSKMLRLNSSTGNPPLPTLPFELVVEILYKLPVKSLTQFKSVCKCWKELISDSNFAKKHFHLSATRHHLLLSKLAKHEYIFNAFTLPPVFTKKVTPTATHKLDRKDPRINIFIGSCHGILCFDVGQAPLLWNPSTQKLTQLPPPQIIPDREGRMAPYMNYGFGYDHSTDTYKVVAFACTEYNTGVYKVQTHVHTMGTNFWKRIQADFPGVPPIWEPGKFVSGTINCLVKDSKRVIVSFDLKTESYRRLLLPVVTSTFCVLRDCLSIVSNSKTFSDVWLMKEYGNQDSWTKLFHVPYKGDVGWGNYTRALYVYDDDRVLLEHRRKLVVYNSRDATFKTLRIQKYGGCMMPEVFQESLISPCSE